MTIHPKTARIEARAITLFAAALNPNTIAAVIAELLEDREAAVWPTAGEGAGGVSGGGTSDPTASRAGSPDFTHASGTLDEIERHLRLAVTGLAYLTRLKPAASLDLISTAKVRCGDMTPDVIRRDEWYSGDVAACSMNADYWIAADGSQTTRSSGLCSTHRKDWDAEQRNRAERDPRSWDTCPRTFIGQTLDSHPDRV